jgi:hypothetical protein
MHKMHEAILNGDMMKAFATFTTGRQSSNYQHLGQRTSTGWRLSKDKKQCLQLDECNSSMMSTQWLLGSNPNMLYQPSRELYQKYSSPFWIP